MKFKKFKKIGQFKDSIVSIKSQSQYVGKDENGESIYDETRCLPTVVFKGTVKLHGTNAGIHYDFVTNEITPQKRTSYLTEDFGHFGFTEYIRAFQDFYKYSCRKVCEKAGITEVVVFGEWVGEGIQKNVAISELSKRFVVFEAFSPEKGCYLDPCDLDEFRDHSNKCYNIRDYKQYEVTVDLNHPELAIKEINNIIDEVEKCCPVAKAMLEAECPEKCVDRDVFLGEGVVFSNRHPFNSSFKSKGEKHSAHGGSKRPSVDPIKAANIKDFVKQVVTEDRLEQCWGVIEQEYGEGNMTTKQIGELMGWIFKDIISEEGDALAHNNLCKKDIGSEVANTARPWFINKINSFQFKTI